jgi:two-component system response regulator HydG
VPPKLLAISGPLRKSEYPMGPEVLLGRDADSAIRLDDPAVSPHHCRIEWRDGRSMLIDLDSDSGTFVNGIPVKQRELNPGDEIAVGNSVFLFEVEAEKNAMSSVRMSELDTPNVKALEFHAEELLSLEPESLGALPQPLRRARNLSALLQICRVIGSLRDEESLPWQLLGVIFDVIPAQRGAILLLEEDSHEIRSQVAWDREHGPAHSVEVSREVVRRVIDEKVSLMDNGAGNRGTPQRALLCVPMISKEKIIGLIYLESSSPVTALTEDDFQLLTAIAGLGVVGIENARQFESLGSENQRLRAEVSLTHDMVGRSPRMREVYQFI